MEGVKKAHFTIPLGRAGADQAAAPPDGAAVAEQLQRVTHTNKAGDVSVTLPAGYAVRFLSDEPPIDAPLTLHPPFAKAARFQGDNMVDGLRAYATIDDKELVHVKQTLALAIGLPTADFSIDYDKTRGTAFEEFPKVTLDLSKGGDRNQKLEVDLQTGAMRFFENGALRSGTIADFNALHGLAAPVAPPVIDGTEKKQTHPDTDPWRNAAARRFHGSDAIRAGQKNQFETAADALRTAWDAPVATQVPWALADFVSEYPPPPGSRVRFTVEEFQGEKLYAYICLTPDPKRDGHEMELQLYSKQGRVVGVNMTMLDEFLPKLS